ncbi:MAG TPA: hypothetical protein VF702_10060 [Allosphingosinicella sp.]|jgi:hypothetical protein
MKTAIMAAAALAAALAAWPAAGQQQPAPGDRAAQREAQRAERSQRFYVALWLIQPGDEPLGRRSIREGEYVVRGRLFPPGLIRLTTDAVAERGGRVIVPSGTQLFGLSTSGAPIWCELNRRSGGAVRGALLGSLVGRAGGGARRQICLTDLDKDGRLDAHFSAGSPVRGVPNFSGYLPRNPDRLTGGAYETLEPGQIATDYFVGIRYEGLSAIGANPTFSVSFGHDDTRARLTETLRPQNGAVTALGAEFTIAGREGETLEIDLRRNLRRQPFHVMQTISYR